MKKIRKVAGQISSRMRREKNGGQEYWKQFLRRLSELSRYRRDLHGYHVYQGGRIFSVGNPVEEDNYAKLTVGFRDSKPSFIDVLFETSTRDFQTCDISFFLKDQDVDFEIIKKKFMSRCKDLREEKNGNFTTYMRNKGKMLRFSAYPQMNIITVSRSFSRGGESPSQFLERFVEVKLNGD